MLLSFLKDINAVIFGILFMLFIMPTCMLLSLGLYFMRITEENLQAAFSPTYLRLVTQEAILIPSAIIALVCIVFVIAAVSWAIAYARRPVFLPDFDPKVHYEITGSPQPQLEDSERRFVATPHRTIASVIEQIAERGDAD